MTNNYYLNTATTISQLMAIFSGEPESASYRPQSVPEQNYWRLVKQQFLPGHMSFLPSNQAPKGTQSNNQ